MDDIVDQGDDHSHETALADVSSTPIDELIRSANPVLAESIRNIREDLGNPEDAIASWQSFIE